ncbi:HlyD family type I secretion periplasmic adaptor subunit [Komagataeibacter rhaeticus]|uniref:Membrane fusion protein (MFP) family protein n=1 Tax=Komagataeibacter rhaeticus TaxID=215221 RepID=A0A181C6V2_9PROT|nr:HlyD family type I secretion periplasmic adaptor subunit [Komagataeibacter rhaeticus]ATU73818.1 HlyD family type I secretion periplasmic adaptor subunit [Komagataeibacter xylinus]EGG78390.1 Protein CyaD [Gluconacetobacter sp. SXCC-1]KDU94833.1 multidrug ABC transporter [Komagataeibacter rhaeticus AF1]MBL7239305.1 HlyD family type I secretion periplasmic adaptor subunit [Komagataeibacter rhaeticus]PYD55093.1 HlyD family type I secretion periplasmic adaptor subunit [Komagataeibacter rhaeticus
MNGHDLVPPTPDDGDGEGAGGILSVLPPPEADMPTDLPPALLAFYSPSAALVELPPSDAARYVIWLVAALAGMGLAVMTFFPLDRVVSVNGRLTPFDETMVLQPLETSIIRSIEVHEGDTVHKGQILARLDPTMTDADVNNLRRQVTAYRAEVARRTAEAAGRPYVADVSDPASVQEAAAYLRRQAEYNAQMSSYDRQVAGLQSELQGYEASAAMYAARARVAHDVQDMRLQLQHEQVGSRLSTLAAQDTLMEVTRSQVAARHEADSTRARLDAMKAQRDGYASNWHATVYQDLALAQHRLADADGSYSKAILQHELIIMRADRDATVLSIAHLSAGSVIQAASPLLTLVPAGSHLDMEATLRGVDAGYVRAGDHALLKFAAFPYTQYGGAEASVRVISPDSFAQPGDGPGGGAQQGSAPGDSMNAYYRVRLSIDRYTLHGVPAFFHPQPGMPVEADIHVGRRTVMQYLLNRLIPAVTDGMREP